MSARRSLAVGAACVAVAVCGAWAMTPSAHSALPAEPVVPAVAAPVLPADDAPRGMVAFVDGTSCPSGWAPATIAQGRLLVGTDQATAVGRVVGAPLAGEEDRAHEHALAGATIALPYKSISAANGGNQAGAASGPQPVTGAVAPAPTGLPFVQLLACVSP